MNKQIRQWNIHSITNEPANARGVIPLPLRIDGKRNFGWPTRERARRQQDSVAERFVSPAAFVEHSGKHRYIEIGIIINAYFAFAFVKTMKPPRVLRHCSAPRYRQC